MDGAGLESLCRTIAQQAKATEYLIKNHKASLLPNISIPTFKGDALEYNSFMGSFDYGIEGCTDDNRDRLHFFAAVCKWATT